MKSQLRETPFSHEFGNASHLLIPSVINKSDALNYVKEITGKNTVIAAGDSLLDISMLKASDYPIVPGMGAYGQSQSGGSLLSLLNKEE